MNKKIGIILLFISLWALPLLAQADTPMTGAAKNEMAGDFKFDLEGLADDEYRPRITERCDAKGCFLKGFLWNETAGWIALEGDFIAQTLFGGDAGDFNTDKYARISASNGALTGYAWSDNGGWVLLNSGAVNELPINQTKDNWGAYLDYEGDRAIADDGSVIGYRFRGFSWSQKLGWIKFSKEANDEAGVPTFAVHANWYPDNSPPTLLGADKQWFRVSSALGALTWENFARDAESGIRLTETAFILTTTQPGCDPGATAFPTPTADGAGIDLNIVGAGLLSGVSGGVCPYTLSGVITNNAGMRFNVYAALPDPVPPVAVPPTFSVALHFYVKAGDLNEANSAIAITNADTALADGSDVIRVNWPLQDIAGNPLMNIAPDAAYEGSPGRAVNVEVAFTNQMRFDATEATPPLPENDNDPKTDYLPVRIKDLVTEALDFGESVTFSPAPVMDGLIRLDITSFAPNTGDFNDLTLNVASVTIRDDGLNPGDPATDQNIPDRILNRDFNFLSPLVASLATVSSGGVDNQVTIGVPADLSYRLNNRSSLPLPNLDLDQVFILSNIDDGLFLDFQKIQDQNAQDETALGWTDPLLLQTRYELYKGKLKDDGEAINGINSRFKYKDNFLPFYEEGGDLSDIRDDGTYALSCDYPIPMQYAKDADGDCSQDGQIDRSDWSGSLELEAASVDPDSGALVPATLESRIQFTVEKILPVAINQANFGIQQFIGYRFPGQPRFTLLETQLIPSVSLQDIGVQYTGLGAGKSIYQTDSRSKAINEIDTGTLTTVMRQNVASLTKNITPCPAGTSLNLSALPVSGSCVTSGSDGSVVAFYEGAAEDILTLTCEACTSNNGILVPAGKRYTLVLGGGASLYLKNNIAYGNALSSLGIILLSNDEGEGGNLYIDPAPTNLVGTVYAEGSVMSYTDDPGIAGGPFFYGGANPGFLSNQLLWQGSMASKNTIGGASTQKVPSGRSCSGLSPLNCAQRYDLNFLRRFTVSGSTITNNGKFSGGGSCSEEGCALGSGTLESLITLTDTDGDGTADAIDSASSTLDPFFIQKDDRRINVNPPPGFRTATEQQFFQEIR